MIFRLNKSWELENSLMEAEENMGYRGMKAARYLWSTEFLRKCGRLTRETSLDPILKDTVSSDKELKFILELIKSH